MVAQASSHTQQGPKPRTGGSAAVPRRTAASLSSRRRRALRAISAVSVGMMGVYGGVR